MKLFLASWLLEPWQGEVLTKTKYTNRLISYYHTIPKADKLSEYVLTGMNKEKSTLIIKRNYEVWKNIKGFPGYQVSCFGRIRSLDKIVNSKHLTRKRKGKILKPWKVNGGYLMVSLFNPEKIRKSVHLLVIENFGSKKPTPKHECNHKDGDKTNNWNSNLEWVTRQENMEHAIKLGLRKIGQEHGRAKLTEKEVLKIRKYSKKIKQKELAKLFKVSFGTICAIINKRLWKHI